MLDHLIRGASVVDGTGAPATTGDVGVRDGKIVAVGKVDEPAKETIDAGGLVLTPGFIDPHTHYDAQLWWDPYATPSNVHGVTSVIAGNCGFTLAPTRPSDVEYICSMLSKVEGMSLAALKAGIDWRWESFGEFLDGLDGGLGVNAGFLVGHCAIRHYVMGDAALERDASPDEMAAMVLELKRSLAAGGLGFSTTRSPTHSDTDNRPVASRVGPDSEVIELCRAVGEYPGTTLEAIVEGCNYGFSDLEIDTLVAMSAAARRPINWNVLTVDSKARERAMRQLEPSRRSAAAGARVVALTMPTLVPMNMSLRNFCAIHQLPQWSTVFNLPIPERIEKLRDPSVRAWLLAQSKLPEAGVFARLADFGNYVVGDTFSEANAGRKGRVVADIAREQGKDPFDMFVEIGLNDELKTVWWPTPTDDDAASWELRRQIWETDGTLIGGSDAGAHLDRMCGSQYTTAFLADTLRGRKLLSLERAVQLMTDAPARLFGLRGRGRIAEGWQADLVLLDPATVDAQQAYLAHDLPAGALRLKAEATGIERVFVNGVETVRNGATSGNLPGIVLRSGRDTDTVATA
ncbi:MAG: amidohydrolase family protein [Acidimicrobiales bacterium]